MASAINSTQLERLRGTSSVASRFVNRVRISATPNRIVFQALINQTTFGDSFASVIFDTVTIGTYTDIIADMTVYIGPTTDLSKAVFTGRARKNNSGVVATATTLNINENSFDIQNNWVLTVTEDFRIWDKLNRDVGGTQYEDWDITFHQLLPIINDLDTSYVGDVDPDTSEMELHLNPSLLVTTSGATAGTPTWDIGDCSFIDGGVNDDDITLSVPEGHRYIHLSWPDSGGRTQVRHVEIHAHGDTYTYQLMAVENLSFTHPVGSGRDGSLTNYIAPDGLLDLTQITVWSDDSDQVADGSISGNNIIFVGRIRSRQNDSAASEQYGIEKSASYTLEGPLTQASRTEQLPYEMLNVSGTPTVFGQIKDMTLWRGIVYVISHSTFLNLYSLNFDDTSNDFIAPTRNPSGDVLTACNDLALSINAALQMDGAGRAEVVRNGVMLETTGQRNALVTRANITTSDLISISIKQDGARPVGKVTASGGSYNTTTEQYLTTEAIAPGVAQDTGSESRTLDRQVFAANLSQAALDAALKTRANHALEKSQQVDTISATFTPQWHSLLTPSLNLWWTFTVAADITVDGEVVGRTVLGSSTRWQLVSADLSYNAEGIPDVKANFIRETIGITKGLTVVYPPAASPTIPSVPTTPSIPMFQVPPLALPELPTGSEIPVFPPGQVNINLPLDGNAWIVGGSNDGTQSLLLTTTMLILEKPYTRELVPPDLEAGEEIQQALVNPVDQKGLYALYYNTVDDTSRIWYLEDVVGYPLNWSAGDTVVGQYTEMRLLKGNGKVAILGADSGGGTPFTDTFDFATGQHGWAITTSFGTYTGTAFQSADGVVGQPPFDQLLAIDYSYPPSTTISTIEVFYTTGANFNGGTRVVLTKLSGIQNSTTGLDGGTGTFNTTVSLGVIADQIHVQLDTAAGATAPTNTITKIIVTGTTPGASQAVTRTSSDFGATLSNAEAVGSVATWFDTQKDGTQLLVGDGSQTYKAAIAGSYSAYGSAKASSAGFVPRYLLPPGTLTNGSSNPQSVIFASILDSGESMWLAKSNNSSFTDISPIHGSDVGLSVNTRNIIGAWLNSSHILAIGLFDTDVLLAVSINGGTAWHFSSALDEDAFHIVTQRGDRLLKLAGFINGDKVAVVRNYQANPIAISERTFNLTSIATIDVFG